jgi:hypothetical protein
VWERQGGVVGRVIYAHFTVSSCVRRFANDGESQYREGRSLGWRRCFGVVMTERCVHILVIVWHELSSLRALILKRPRIY